MQGLGASWRYPIGYPGPRVVGVLRTKEIRASSLQFVRKLSGFARPSQANQLAFDRAVDQVTEAARELLASLVINAPPRDRTVEAAKARARAAGRFPASGAR